MPRQPEQPDEPTQLSPSFLLHKEGYSIKDYKLVARIGEGSFGQVWKAERGGFDVALKILKASVNSEETQRELKSLETLKKLHHRYLLHTENFWSDGDQLYIEMELADGGTLKDRFKACIAEGRAGIPEDELLKYFTEAAKALDYLHGHRPVFLHRDIKPANVLLVKGCAKLGDFGLLRQVSNNDATHTQGGTIPYMAPESIKEDRFSVFTDLFSFAVMYAELRQGSLPFMGNNQFQICERIMKEPPKLTDIFDPAERKVLLRALSKSPDDRFASCGEFVFELNRVVPWLPAVNVPTSSALGSGAPDTNPAKTTDSRATKQTDQGTSRRGIPATMPEMELPDEEPAPPSTVRADGTNTGSRQTHSSKQKPALIPPPDQSTKNRHTDSKPKFNSTAEQPKLTGTHVPPRKKKASSILPAVVLLLILGVVFTGVWVLLNQSEQSAVRHKVEDGKYAEAFQDIKNASPLLLPGKEGLLKDLENKWWTSLKAPAADDDPDHLAKKLAKVKEFQDAFPQHADAAARQGQIQDLLVRPVKKPPNPNLAKERRDKVLAGLIIAKDEIENHKFEDGLNRLKALEPEEKEDHAKQVDLRTKAIDGVKKRNADHAKLLKELEKLNDGNHYPAAVAKRDELTRLRTTYPFTDYPALPAIMPAASLSFLVEAWRPLLADKVLAKDAHQARDQALKKKTQFADDVNYKKHLAAFEAFVLAYDADIAADWSIAVEALAKVQRDMNPPDDLCIEFWPALVRLEANREKFRLRDLKKIDDTLPMPHALKRVRESHAQLISLALERIAKQSTYPWYPDDADVKTVAVLLAKTTKSSALLSTICAECLLRIDAPLDQINPKLPAGKKDWYGAYVAALAKDKSAADTKKDADRIEAANILVEGIKDKIPDITPPQRAVQCVQLVRGAVKVLERKKHDFVQEGQARSAIVWLSAVYSLIKAEQEASEPVDDLVNLAYAAVKTLDLATMKDKAIDGLGVRDRNNKATPKGYALITEAALKLAEGLNAVKSTPEAIEASKLCQKTALALYTMDTKPAADLNGKAVNLYALIEYAKKSKIEDYYQAFAHSANQKPMTAFYLPVVLKKVDYAPTIAERLTTIVECEQAVNSAKKVAEAEKHKENREWWQNLRFTTMLKIGEKRLGILTEKLNNKVLNAIKDKDELRAESLKALEWYKQAKPLEKYSGKPGEASYVLGDLYYRICESGPDVATQKREAEAGLVELQVVVDAIESIPANQRTPEQIGRQNQCKAYVNELKELVKKLSAK